MVAAALRHTRPYARAQPPLRRLLHSVQLSEGKAVTIMKGASRAFRNTEFGRDDALVQDKLPSSRSTALLGFVAIRLASRAHQ